MPPIRRLYPISIRSAYLRQHLIEPRTRGSHPISLNEPCCSAPPLPSPPPNPVGSFLFFLASLFPEEERQSKLIHYRPLLRNAALRLTPGAAAFVRGEKRSGGLKPRSLSLSPSKLETVLGVPSLRRSFLNFYRGQTKVRDKRERKTQNK